MRMPLFVAALEYIQTTWPSAWARNGGRDHFVVENSDWGICEVEEYGRGSPKFDTVMVLSLWGHARNSGLGAEAPCFRPGKDIVLPPFMDPIVYKHAAQARASPDPAPKRDILAFFRGFSGEGSQAWEGYTWSFGVRQNLFKVFEGRENETGMLIQGSTGQVSGFLEMMERSVFCIAPSGWGWGMRTTQAVILGCIPVVIQVRLVTISIWFYPFCFQLFDPQNQNISA